MSEARSLDPVERTVLAFLVSRLDAGDRFVSAHDFEAHLRSLDAESRSVAISTLFEALRVLEWYETPPPKPTRPLTWGSQEAHRLMAYHQTRVSGWNITGRAIVLSRALQANAVGTGQAEGADTGGTSDRGGGRCEGSKSKRRPGRKPGSKTADADTRLYRDWKAAHDTTGITKAEFVRERGLPEMALASLERGRANVKRKRASGRNGRA